LENNGGSIVKILSHEQFEDLSYDKRKIIAGAVAKKFLENLDEEEIRFHLVMGLMSEWTHEGWGYEKYEDDIKWMNNNG
jgi:F0F1-type ATP synthase alpha subunit